MDILEHYFNVVISVLIILIIYWVRCRTAGGEKAPLNDDYDDDIRENIMYYDEEGAGMSCVMLNNISL